MSKEIAFTRCITDEVKCDKHEMCLRRSEDCKRGTADYIAIYNEDICSWWIEMKNEVEVKDGESDSDQC